MTKLTWRERKQRAAIDRLNKSPALMEIPMASSIMAAKEKPTEEQTQSQIPEEHPPEVKMPQEQPQEEQPPERQIDRSKRDRSTSVECIEDKVSKKAKQATRTDDSHTPNNNPKPSDGHQRDSTRATDNQSRPTTHCLQDQSKQNSESGTSHKLLRTIA